MTAASPLNNTLLDHVLNYANQGLELFPCKPENKHPYTANGMNDATSNTDTLQTWWRQWPDAIIGCRIPDDIVVLDIDPRHHGHETWQALQDTFGPLPHTRRHASGRGDGGQHWWFKRPTDERPTIKKINEWARQNGYGEPAGKKSWVSGIDILHHRHRYTILPPSPHPDTGMPYLWKVKATPAAMPEWLAGILSRDPVIEPTLRVVKDSDGIADWYTTNHSWHDVLPQAGWNLVEGNGDGDGSKWRHPNATSEHSATIKHGCLFVYSPNTDFDETEEGDPNGYTRFRAWAILEHDADLTAAAAAAYELRDGPRPQPREWMPEFGPRTEPEPAPAAAPSDLLGMLINWEQFWAKDHKSEEWLAWPILPKGRQVALYAPAKTGKSIVTLAVVAALATGQPILGNPAQPPIHVLYLDYEMTEGDLYERLEALGYGPDTDLTHLHYASLPSLPPLNTALGADRVVQLVQLTNSQAVVVDTTGRAVDGDENDAGPYREFASHTGIAVKRLGVALLRTDHAGKDKERGQRGSSAKNDDVDVVFRLDVADDGYMLTRTHTRIGWVPDRVAILRHEETALEFVAKRQPKMTPEGTKDMADKLDRYGIPLEASKNTARKLLSEQGVKAGNNAVLNAALNYRRTRANNVGTGPGTARINEVGDHVRDQQADQG